MEQIKNRKNTQKNLVKEFGKILRIRKNNRENEKKYSRKLGKMLLKIRKILQKFSKNTSDTLKKIKQKGSHLRSTHPVQVYLLVGKASNGTTHLINGYAMLSNKNKSSYRYDNTLIIATYGFSVCG